MTQPPLSQAQLLQKQAQADHADLQEIFSQLWNQVDPEQLGLTTEITEKLNSEILGDLLIKDVLQKKNEKDRVRGMRILRHIVL